MKFKYLAKRGPKEKIEGVLDVISKEEAVKSLISQGLFPIKVERDEDNKTKVSFSAPRRISQTQLLNFTRQIHNLLKAHVGILKSLRIMEKQVDQNNLKNLINSMHQNIKEGMDFSKVLEGFPHIFSPFYVSLVKVGEVSGRLDFSLEKICDYLEQQQDLKRKVISSLAYPIMMILVGIATTIVLFTFVIPRLSGIFDDLGQDLPWITKTLLNISFLFRRPSFWWICVLGVIAGSLYQRISPYKMSLKGLLKKVPFFRKILLLEAVTTFSYTLSLLIKSGVPLLESLNVSKATLQDKKLVQEVEVVRNEVIQGASLSESIVYLKSFPKFLSNMIAIGEETGALSEIIDTTAQVLSKDLDMRLKMVSSLIEPIIIFTVGIVLGITH